MIKNKYCIGQIVYELIIDRSEDEGIIFAIYAREITTIDYERGGGIVYRLSNCNSAHEDELFLTPEEAISFYKTKLDHPYIANNP